MEFKESGESNIDESAEFGELDESNESVKSCVEKSDEEPQKIYILINLHGELLVNDDHTKFVKLEMPERMILRKYTYAPIGVCNVDSADLNKHLFSRLTNMVDNGIEDEHYGILKKVQSIVKKATSIIPGEILSSADFKIQNQTRSQMAWVDATVKDPDSDNMKLHMSLKDVGGIKSSLVPEDIPLLMIEKRFSTDVFNSEEKEKNEIEYASEIKVFGVSDDQFDIGDDLAVRFKNREDRKYLKMKDGHERWKYEFTLSRLLAYLCEKGYNDVTIIDMSCSVLDYKSERRESERLLELKLKKPGGKSRKFKKFRNSRNSGKSRNSRKFKKFGKFRNSGNSKKSRKFKKFNKSRKI
jgi:hypothetical protein